MPAGLDYSTETGSRKEALAVRERGGPQPEEPQVAAASLVLGSALADWLACFQEAGLDCLTPGALLGVGDGMPTSSELTRRICPPFQSQSWVCFVREAMAPGKSRECQKPRV